MLVLHLFNASCYGFIDVAVFVGGKSSYGVNVTVRSVSLVWKSSKKTSPFICITISRSRLELIAGHRRCIRFSTVLTLKWLH